MIEDLGFEIDFGNHWLSMKYLTVWAFLI